MSNQLPNTFLRNARSWGPFALIGTGAGLIAYSLAMRNEGRKRPKIAEIPEERKFVEKPESVFNGADLPKDVLPKDEKISIIEKK